MEPAVWLAGIGQAAVAYNIFIINIVLEMMDPGHPQTATDRACVAAATLVGAVVGQLVIGVLVDRLTVRHMFVATSVLTAAGAVGSACVQPGCNVPIYVQLAVARVVLGVGVGGEYPVGAKVASAAASSTAGSLAGVFSMQGLGTLLTALAALAVLAAGCPLDLAWRLALAVGALPALLTLHSRWQHAGLIDAAGPGGKLLAGAASAAETTDAGGADSGMRAPAPVAELGWWRKHKPLVGTAGSWFLFDLVYYSNGLFSATVARLILANSSSAATAAAAATTTTSASVGGGGLMEEAVATMLLAVVALPGYWVSVVYLDKLGCRLVQQLGFGMLAVLFTTIGLFYPALQQLPSLFFLLYSLTFFFSNFGPNVTTYVVPATIFPPQVRATYHGISAATGKAGAALGGFLLPELQTAVGLQCVFLACGCVSAVGVLWTAAMTPEDCTPLARWPDSTPLDSKLQVSKPSELSTGARLVPPHTSSSEVLSSYGATEPT